MAQALIFPDDIQKDSYQNLQKKVDALVDKGVLTTKAISADIHEFFPVGLKGVLEIHSVAPNSDIIRKTLRADLQRFAANPTARTHSNELSIMLVLCARGGDGCNMYFMGDIAGEAVEIAFNKWKNKALELGCSHEATVLKVPHHGSQRTHHGPVCKWGVKGKRTKVAAISCGERASLPHSNVLLAFLNQGWKVLLTTKRGGEKRPPFATSQHPMTLAARQKVFYSLRSDIVLKWNSESGLDYSPLEAELAHSEVKFYKEPRSKSSKTE
jgi:hypothetical protein